jgi:hypothetical protein
MWNIKKESRVTVAPEVVNEDHFLAVNFGHEFDDATDEPKSVTSRRESQQRRRWPSAGAINTWIPQASGSAGRGPACQVAWEKGGQPSTSRLGVALRFKGGAKVEHIGKRIRVVGIGALEAKGLVKRDGGVHGGKRVEDESAVADAPRRSDGL